MYHHVLRAFAFALVFLTSMRLYAAAPTATTSAATSITTNSASLNGAGVPNSEQTTGWFRISSTNPGTCDDLFGTRVPAAGGTDLGSGAASVPYSITATGLVSGVTYYFCAIVQNASGTAFGSVLSFTVPGAPTVTTTGVNSVTSTSATLLGSANPNASSATGWFRYSTTSPGTCNDSFGTRSPTSGGTALGSGTSSVDYTRAISGLTPGATYYYCAISSNAYGTSFGALLSFTALPDPPAVTTTGATLVTGTTAQLNGTANPGGAATTGWFRYSTTSPGTCNDMFGTRAPASGGQSLGAGNTAVAYSLGVTGLLSSTTYYYCAIASNSAGTSFGSVLSFSTPSAPTTTTSAATSIGNTSAQLNGSASPNGASATGYFRFALTDPGACNDVFGSRAPASGGTALGSGTSAVSFSQFISGLSPNTTYYYCAIASNSEGLGFGTVLSFTTADVPITTTSAATSVTSSSAVLNGAADPNGNSAFGFFRYSTTNPGTCDDLFGTRAPPSSASDTSLGSGSSPVSFNRTITGLSPATTYYFCALGRNSYGTTFGTVMSFTTLANPPSVTTNSATALTGTTATLNGSVVPGGAAATGWFRYATASPGTCNDSFGTRAPAAGGTSLGSGNSSVAYSQAISGLTAGTTYYFCAIADNVIGMSFGSVVSFTTPLPPTTTTQAVSSLSNSAAQLNGAANPNGSSTTGYFRYSLTNPGTCDDVFGSRAPASGGTALGSGNSAVSFSQFITGLSANTTYYYCAIAQSFEGTTFGAIMSFTTHDVPATTTNAATSITSTSVTLNGAADPNGNSAFGFFRYSTVNPGTCNDSFGTRAPTSSVSDTSLGAGTVDVPFNRSVGSLTPGTTYYFCALARNSYGTTFGAVMSFTTLANAPNVSTGSATSVTGTTATLNGSADPGGSATTGWFRYATASPGTCNDSFGTRAPAAGGTSLGSGNGFVAYSQPITGLVAGTTYYYCAIAQNAVGTSVGSVVSFTTPLPPTTTTTAASSVGNTSAQLNGTSNPNGSSTTGWFRYSLTNPMTCDDMFGSRAPASGGSAIGSGTSAVSYSQFISGLSPNTTYYYCAISQSVEGTTFGSILSFTTADVPTTTTFAATSVTASSAVLNGDADPNGSSAFGFFRYSTVNPGTCNDSFGTRAPTSSVSDTSLGAGTAPVAFNRTISGLTPGTTYYFCALGRNSYGTTFGTVLSFTTLANAPNVTTVSATSLTGTTATLNGSADPGGSATTGWFRYATASPGSCNDSFGTRAPAAGGSSLGSGNGFVAYSQPITGLVAGTTYYYCAIGQNSVGTAFGAVLSFTTPLPPVTVTNAASSIGNTSAQLNGSANPNGSSTTGWFRYATTNPGTCDDVFGSRAPTSGGTALGSGNTSVSYSQFISGLSPNTTYYFCAISQSFEGTTFGSVLSFTTADAPTTTTFAATSVTASSAVLNGDADPNGNSAFGFFRYSTTNPGVCNDSFGTRAPTSSVSDTSLGAGTTPVAFNRSISGLLPGTTYYFCALGRNSYGTTFGAVLSFTTLATPPSVTTQSATSITTTGATLNANATPNGAATTGWFRYSTLSPGTCNDSFGTRAPAAGGTSLGSGVSGVAYSQAITGLTPGTTYYFCAIAENATGMSFGSVLSFQTTAPPTVITLAATPVTATTATLNGTVNPNGFSTTGYFRYSTTNPGACDTAFGTATATSALGSGTSAVALAQPLTGLLPATTYYFCAIATSSIGTSLGAVLSFTTPAAAPTVTTVAASSVLSTTATLNATAAPNGSDTTGWFRYSTTNPGTCNDMFGTRAPAAGGTMLGTGSVAVPYSQGITGLTAGVTYYFCAIAQSAIGTSVGAVLSFTTASAPTVTTSAATAITSSGATLNGSANPNFSAATGWFRYSTTNPGTCDDVFGTRAPAAGGTSLGSGSTSVAFSQAVTGLAAATTYYYCAIADNAVGMSFGSVLSFTTAAVPTVTTAAATAVASTTATLNGSANPNLLTSTGWFRYSTTNPGTCTDAFGTRAPAAGGTALGAGSSPVAYSQAISGLVAGTTYYYCAIASNSAGTGFGAVMSFTTTAIPTVTTVAASSVTNNSATLNGSANPNLATATGWFRYSTTNPGTCSDAFGTRAPAAGGTALGAGNTPVAYSQAVSGLAAGTTYYYCAIASNAVGTGLGTVMSFTTTATPVVTTSAATTVTSTTATLNGSGNPKLDAATGWFRYSTTSPGTCNDVFGTRAPAAGGTALGSGNAAVPYSEPITGLTPGTTYYFCAIAQNGIGTGVGTVLSFTTTAAPVVTTNAATAVGATTATLNGSANPKLDAATGWFRYSATNPGTCDDSFGTRAPAAGGTSLGAGNSAVAYSQALTGLTSATTYYFCAIAQNSVGTSFGSVLSFTTAAVPNVTTVAASAITSTGATLNGSANPNLLTSTGWFRYSTTNPGTCTDAFGTRAPAAGGTALGAGNAQVAYSQAITGLAAGTTYYYCAIASNSAGTGFGTVMSFTTAGIPSVTTVAASAVTNTGATLNGSATPNLLSATGWFRYSTTSPGTCNDVFGTRAPAAGGTALGAGSTPVAYSQAITGLTAGTTYYYCAIAQNGAGTGFGAVMSFTTTATPVVTTVAASAITSSGATLNGTANPKLDDATGWFRFSTTNPGACNDVFGTRAPAAGGTALGNGNTAVPYSEVLTGLAPATTYYFCAIAQNAVGTGFGAVMSFTTTAAPSVTTAAASAISGSGATLNGSANPNLDASTGWFRYDTTSPGTCNDSFGTRAPAAGGTALGAGSSAIGFAQVVTGLSSGTTYYFCAIAQNSNGTAFGAVLSFTTASVPAVTTAAASNVTSTSALLNGSATPNLLAATGWFRYSTTDPGACSDAFGTRAPAAGGAALGSGSTPVAFAQPVSGLVSGTTYYYCAIASNSAGTGFGAVMSFTTPAAPTVVTNAATLVTSNGATLNGSADPNLADATGWFRYSATQPATCNDMFGTRAPAAGGTALGAGDGPVDYAQIVTGLMPATTYYFCAIAQNSLGKSYGQVLSFTTLSPPTVTTLAATAVSDTGATLNGSADPNLADATGWFRYDTTDPGACDDSFGTRAPAAGGTALGAGNAPVAYAEVLSGLTPGTTYYFCAIAENSEGKAFGSVLSFTTQGPPLVTTDPASMVLATAAVLNGSANPNQLAATGWFRFDTVDPGACDDTFGTRAPSAGGTALGSGTSPVAYFEAITGLMPDTTYYYCAIAENPQGKAYGQVLSFTTAGLPLVTTNDASDLTASDATLNGSANPNLSDTTAWFRYDTTDPGACDDMFGTRAPASGGTLIPAGATPVDFSEAITGLLPGTTYYVCAIAQNDAGVAFGEVLSFTTEPDAPTVETTPATDVLAVSATLNGSANPNGATATGWFRYDTTNPGTCDDSFGVRIPAAGGTNVGGGTDPVAFSEAVTGLLPAVKYYYCAIASNAQGKSYGEVLSFTTGEDAPTVVTNAATDVGAGATLQGTATPNGSDTTGWFRYGDFDPVDCDDSFGTRAPASGGFDLGAGTTPFDFSQPIADLEPNMTYYFCAAASNDAGAAFGEVLSFTTDAVPPEVKTGDALVDVNNVTVDGSANPKGSGTVGWFRFDSVDPGECNDTFGNRVPAADGTDLGDGRELVPFTENLGDLLPGTFYYCAIAENEAGVAYGELKTFQIRDEDGGGGGDGGGCGCRVSSDRTSTAASISFVALLLLALRRRRRQAA